MTSCSDPAPGDLPDEDLMLLVARGFISEPANELFNRHHRALFNFLAWLCRGNLAEAEDLAQKTWENLITRGGNYAPTARFRTYLFQIGRNAWLDQQRASERCLRDEMPPDTVPSDPDTRYAPDPLQARLDAHRQAALQDALCALPFAQREVVVLRYFADMSLEEIAQTVGAGFETVKSRLRYAFAALRRTLGNEA